MAAALCVLSIGGRAAPPQTKPMAPPARDVGAQPPAPAGAGGISGTLVADDTGRAVRRARVTLSGGDARTIKSVTTDERGAFSFMELSAGEFTLSASKGGFLDVVYGQRRPGVGKGGTPIRLLPSQRLEHLELKIPRGGVITGTITDEAGDPAFGVSVRALRYVWRTGDRSLQQVGGGTTDDRGIYRIPALPPGEYVVTAVPREGSDEAAAREMKMRMEEVMVAAQASGNSSAIADAKMAMAGGAASDTPAPSSGYAPVYFSGTTQAAAATSVILGVSEEHGGVDLQLQVVPLATVSGSVLSPQGPAGSVQLQLINRAQPAGLSTHFVRAAADGPFNFSGVAPGQYTIVARASTPSATFRVAPQDGAQSELAMMQLAVQKAGLKGGGDPLWGMTDVVVDGRGLSNVTVVLQRGMTVSGSVSFEGGSTPGAAQLARLAIALAPAAPMADGEVPLPAPATVDAEGRFTVRGVAPGLYRVVAAAGVPPGYTIKSSVFGGRDSLDFPIEVKPGEDQAGGLVTFNTRAAEVSGTLQDSNGVAAPGYTVVVFAADARYWTPQSRRVQATRPATDGRFGLRGLPAGDYRIAAVTEVEDGQWFDPAFLRQIVGTSVAFTLGDGERRTQDLRIR